jgi:hypothetical protein
MTFEILHEVIEKNDYSQIKISRTYKANNQLFRITLSTHNKGSYCIYRFSNDSGWNWIEAEGDSFISRPDLKNKTPYLFMDELEQTMLNYSVITKEDTQ